MDKQQLSDPMMKIIRACKSEYLLACLAVSGIIIIAHGCKDDDRIRRQAKQSIVLANSAPTSTQQCDGLNVTSAGQSTKILGDTTEIHGSGPFPCRLVGVARVALMPSFDGSHPDPATTQVLRHAGSFLTPAHWRMGRERASILVWDSLGRFEKALGRAGDGPGEFSPNHSLLLYPGPNGELWVNEQRRWSVFASDLTFVRTVNLNTMRLADHETIIVTKDGSFIVSDMVAGVDPKYWFHIFDSAGTYQKSFGTKPDLNSDMPGSLHGRKIAYRGGETFWAAPPPGAPAGLVLEEWTTEGRFVRAMRRVSAWMHEPFVLAPGFGATPLITIYIDTSDLMWVGAAVKSPGVNQPIPEAQALMISADEERLDSLWNLWLEVIDIQRGTILASGLIDSVSKFDEGRMPPLTWILGTRQAFRSVRNEFDMEQLEIFDWQIVAHQE